MQYVLEYVERAHTRVIIVAILRKVEKNIFCKGPRWKSSKIANQTGSEKISCETELEFVMQLAVSICSLGMQITTLLHIQCVKTLFYWLCWILFLVENLKNCFIIYAFCVLFLISYRTFD